MILKSEKSRARLQAKARRADLQNPESSIELLAHFPAHHFKSCAIAGYWPISGEIDIRPLLSALHEFGHKICLPRTPRKGHPLKFFEYLPGDALKRGPYGVYEPKADMLQIVPRLILVPLLAFTAGGDRLGYGGGFYDRTLAELRRSHDLFACGVGYAAQEVSRLPFGPLDQRLDGILTENGFRIINPENPFGLRDV